MAAELPPVAPEWVALEEMPVWVERVYGADAAGAMAQKIIYAVRDGELRGSHRIRIKARLGQFHEERFPPGLGYKIGVPFSDRWVVANDWKAAAVDWGNGTVGGWNRDRHRERLPIEVSWEQIALFVEQVLMRQPQTAGPSLPKQRHPGGAPPRYDWWGFAAEMVRKANTPDGLGERAQALKHMREWVARTWEHQPSESVIGDYFSRLYPPET